MEFATEAMGALLPKLHRLLDEEYRLQESVRRDFQYLQRERQSMHAALSAVAAVPWEQLQQLDRLWASDIRELSQDMEDVVDTFLVRIEDPDKSDSDLPSKPECFKGLLVKTADLMKKYRARRQVATAISGIKDQVQEVANRDGRYRGPHGVVASLAAAATAANATQVVTVVDPLLIALYGAPKNIVGIADAKAEVMTKLFQGDDVSRKQLKILSIVGFGGLGKTTLANAVYSELSGKFDCRAFVTVSRHPDVRKVLRDLLYELDNPSFKKWHGGMLLDERKLKKELRKSLQNKRYSIVIDDLWDVQAWETIRYAMVDSNCGSRIITTTRNLDVSKACCSSNNDIIYNMKPLSDNDSRILFYKRIFPSETGCPHELEQVSIEIVKKCGRVPLAIITIASHLAGDQQIKPKDEWDALLNSIGRGLTRGGGVEEMRRILSLGYYDIHYHLKTCFTSRERTFSQNVDFGSSPENFGAWDNRGL